MTIARSGEDIVVSWTGGEPPFRLQKTDSLSPVVWNFVGDPTMVTSKTLPKTGEQGYFRLMQQVQLMDAEESGRLFWLIPELE